MKTFFLSYFLFILFLSSLEASEDFRYERYGGAQGNNYFQTRSKEIVDNLANNLLEFKEKNIPQEEFVSEFNQMLTNLGNERKKIALHGTTREYSLFGSRFDAPSACLIDAIVPDDIWEAWRSLINSHAQEILATLYTEYHTVKGTPPLHIKEAADFLKDSIETRKKYPYFDLRVTAEEFLSCICFRMVKIGGSGSRSIEFLRNYKSPSEIFSVKSIDDIMNAIDFKPESYYEGLKCKHFFFYNENYVQAGKLLYQGLHANSLEKLKEIEARFLSEMTSQSFFPSGQASITEWFLFALSKAHGYTMTFSDLWKKPNVQADQHALISFDEEKFIEAFIRNTIWGKL